MAKLSFALGFRHSFGAQSVAHRGLRAVGRAILVFACGSPAIAAACSSSSSSGGAVTSSDFAQQVCALFEPCCVDAGVATSDQNCISLIGSTTATYDPANGQACVAALKQASKGPNFCIGAAISSQPCDNVFSASSSSGTTAPGHPCIQDRDCIAASGGGAVCLYDSSADGGSSQVCVQTKPGTAGQGPCLGTASVNGTVYVWQGASILPSLGYVCDNAAGLACDTVSQKCVTLASTGQPCSSDGECVAADFCDFSGASNVCAPRLSDGASCTGSRLSGCLATSYCDSATQKCTPGLPNGSACTSGEACQSHNCSNDKCSGLNLVLSLLCGS